MRLAHSTSIQDPRDQVLIRSLLLLLKRDLVEALAGGHGDTPDGPATGVLRATCILK